MCDFVVINRNENHAIVGQEVPRQLQPRVHHVEPVGVVPALGLRVGRELLAVFVDLLGPLEVGL
ncbi:hypothetical protein FRC0505_02479 [Corynebacterium diphtheriae]|nr:hypothetical protein FRC0024_02414 [Corynebacterium diphtheriae]CAB0867717.1 hypothetical protein FRC0314_02413 [Corynebacterium diphtheriae]CAB1018314.1 hypothetical protein FRC0505_02479 [Corynebacterium diphtheriae]